MSLAIVASTHEHTGRATTPMPEAHPDHVASWTAAVETGLIAGDPSAYFEGRLGAADFYHALMVAILETQGIDWQSYRPDATPDPDPGPVLQVGMSWQWQLSSPPTLAQIDANPADVYDIDGFEASEGIVAELHSRGTVTIGYMSSAFEDWRPDAASFPNEVKGNNISGWAGERWVDIRRWDLLEPIYRNRARIVKGKGFDAIEWDLMDGYTNNTGFPLTAADQALFNRRLAELSHAEGLLVALKGDVEQAAELEPFFDFAINEQCLEYDECGLMVPFIEAGKPVFHCEYQGQVADLCAAAPEGFSTIRKRVSLGAWRETCPDV